MSDVTSTIYTVTTLNRYVKDVLEEDLVLRSVWVRGEVSNFTHHSSGHMYFTLKDAGGRLKAVMFRGSAVRLRFKPTDGMKVLVLGSVTIYEKSGDIQLYAEHMEPEGKGSLFAAYEQLRDKLQAEGLFSQQRKRQLPPMPKRLAVLTSPTGAAVRDIITIATRRFPGLKITVIPTLVQGDMAPMSILESLAMANSMDDVDVIVLGRGGGSIEELWAFNDEMVARAIFSSGKPVVSAVGHETDFTIADFVADLRAPTPSAAAELVVPDIKALRSRLLQLQSRLEPALSRRLSLSRERLQRLASTNVLTSPKTLVTGRRQEVDELLSDLTRHFTKTQESRRTKLGNLVASLNAMSPLAVLERGYSICMDSAGSIVRDAAHLNPGETVSVRVMRGSIDCEVVQVRPTSKDERRTDLG